MSNVEKLREDIAFVRAATDRSDDNVPCRSIYLLWAVIGLCGFTFMDFTPVYWWINIYWLIAVPIGFALSFWFGKRESIRLGQGSRTAGMRVIYHWIAFLVAGLLGMLLAVEGHLSGPGLGSLWVLLLALTYFLVGIHVDRRMIPVGILVGIGFLISIYLPDYGWTVVGVMLAVSLTAQAYLGVRYQDATN